MLAALLLGSNHDTGRQMREAHGAFCLVDVLAAGAARTKSINVAFPQQVFIGLGQLNHLAMILR